jgi:hypothetical protein
MNCYFVCPLRNVYKPISLSVYLCLPHSSPSHSLSISFPFSLSFCLYVGLRCGCLVALYNLTAPRTHTDSAAFRFGTAYSRDGGTRALPRPRRRAGRFRFRKAAINKNCTRCANIRASSRSAAREAIRLMTTKTTLHACSNCVWSFRRGSTWVVVRHVVRLWTSAAVGRWVGR